MKKRIIYSIVCALLITLVLPIHPFAQANSNVRKVTYEEYLNMGRDTENEDCYERAHDSRRARPSGTAGGLIFDYSLLPDPQEMIFVCINNKFLVTDVPVIAENGSTLLPMRALFEAIGASVTWNGSTNTVTAKLGQSVIEITVGKLTAKVNGTEVTMPVAARASQGRVYIPLRFVSEQLGLTVIWEPNNRIVKVINYPELTVKVVPTQVKANTEDYNYGNYFSIARRFLLKHNGEVHWLQQSGDQIYVQIFDESLKSKGEVTLQRELQQLGGAHVGDDGNFYLIFGQDNIEESDTKTIYRIVKYDQHWNKISQADVKDVHVTKTFHASNLTMDSKDGILVIYSARERYKSDDGINHQSNIPIHVRMDDMTILYSGGAWPRNHVSHSFANYVKMDEGRIVYLDHGDGYPRSIVLQVEESERIKAEINIISFPGRIGDNYTGAQVGGLEVAKDHYLVVGTYNQFSGTAAQLFLAMVPKLAVTDDEVDLVYLTGPSDTSVRETHLVKLDDDRFVLVWSDVGSRHNVSYVIVDAHGKMIGQPKRYEGITSPGHLDPIVLDGKLVWYYQEGIYSKEETALFYMLDIE